MAAGVKVALTSFWTLVNNWKKERNSELMLKSENGRLSVTFSAELGVWEPPSPPPRKFSPSDGSRDHQGPRKGAGPSRQRRREKRAAARAAKASLSDTSEEVVSTKVATSRNAEEAVLENAEEAVLENGEEAVLENADEAVLENLEEAKTADKPAPVRKGRTCTKCGGLTKGHKGQCGQKCSIVLTGIRPVLTTPEKERHTSLPGDLSLTLTPGQAGREEQCVNCEATMLPNHQCKTSQENIPLDNNTREDDIATKRKCQCENMCIPDDICGQCFLCWDCCEEPNQCMTYRMKISEA